MNISLPRVIAVPLRATLESFRSSVEGRTFELWSTIALYVIAIASFAAGLLFSPEWMTRSVPFSFLVSLIFVPIFSITVAFLVQIMALLRESAAQVKKAEHESLFLSSLENSISQSVIHQSFLALILEKWCFSLKQLKTGVVTIQDEYWTVCANFYKFARKRVECTSAIPVDQWLADQGQLQDYLKRQISDLIANGVYVSRTFIIESVSWDDAAWTKLVRVLHAHLSKGFYVFVIELAEFSDANLKENLSADLCLIDDRLLMLGRQSRVNESVWYYDFFDLECSHSYPIDHSSVFTLLRNRDRFLAREYPELLIKDYRKRASALKLLKTDPRHAADKTALEALEARLQHWDVF